MNDQQPNNERQIQNNENNENPTQNSATQQPMVNQEGAEGGVGGSDNSVPSDVTIEQSAINNTVNNEQGEVTNENEVRPQNLSELVGRAKDYVVQQLVTAITPKRPNGREMIGGRRLQTTTRQNTSNVEQEETTQATEQGNNSTNSGNLVGRGGSTGE